MRYLLYCCLLSLVLSSSYDTKVSKELVYMSAIAFDTISDINNWSCKACSKFPLTDVKAFTNTSLLMQGFVGYSAANGAIVVSFRGSDNDRNWIDDFDFGQIPYLACSECFIHNGFYLGYLTISASVRYQIQLLTAKYRGAKVWVTGHSLGGALATIAALDIKAAFNPEMKVYTFGQPRVGNARFATYFASRIPDSFRVIHYADIVPHLPPIDLNFRHYETQVWYDFGMESFKICSAEDKNCADSFHSDKLKPSDHDIGIYMKLPVLSNLREE